MPIRHCFAVFVFLLGAYVAAASDSSRAVGIDIGLVPQGKATIILTSDGKWIATAGRNVIGSSSGTWDSLDGGIVRLTRPELSFNPLQLQGSRSLFLCGLRNRPLVDSYVIIHSNIHWPNFICL